MVKRDIDVFLNLTRKASQNGKITLPVIKMAMTKMIANRSYSNQFGAIDSIGDGKAEYDFMKPKYKAVIGTATLIAGQKAGAIPRVFRADIEFKGKLKDDMYIVDNETNKPILHDVSEMDKAAINKLLMLNAIATTLTWADYYNQRFIMAILKAAKGQGGIKIETDTLTLDTPEKRLKQAKGIKRTMGGKYTTEALGITNNELVYIVNDAFADDMDDLLLDSGNWNRGDSQTLSNMFKDKTGKWYLVDNRITQFLTGDVDKPALIAFVRGGIGQKIAIIESYRLTPADLVGFVKEDGRAKVGEIQLMSNGFFAIMGTKVQMDQATAYIKPDDAETTAIDGDGKEYHPNSQTGIVDTI